MIERIKAFLASGAEGAAGPSGTDELQVATAALLVEAACMDGHVDDRERDTIQSLLAARFEIDGEGAGQLFEAGLAAVEDSNELYRFTRVIKDRYSHDHRISIIEMLWDVAYADGVLHDFEANLVRRVAGLIYVSDRESGTARKRVLSRLEADAAGASRA